VQLATLKNPTKTGRVDSTTLCNSKRTYTTEVNKARQMQITLESIGEETNIIKSLISSSKG
jgi:hypothetical protein